MSRSVLLIDNYDSFVFNLARYVAELGVSSEVVRNDALTLSDIRARRPSAIILSPGPCTPAEAGISEAVVSLGAEIPILGVCLGHQAIATALGGRVVRAPQAIHGKTSNVRHDGSPLWKGCRNPLRATRYHSLIVEEASLPSCLRVTARTDEGAIMAFEHRQWPVFGVQFHPEAVLTEEGHHLLGNFFAFAGIPTGSIPTSGDSQQEDISLDDFYARPMESQFIRPA